MEHESATAIFLFASKGQLINTFSKFYDPLWMSWVSGLTSSILRWEASQRLFLIIYLKKSILTKLNAFGKRKVNIFEQCQHFHCGSFILPLSFESVNSSYKVLLNVLTTTLF